MRSKWLMWLSWTVVCTIAGVVIIMVFGEFLGSALLGGALGLVQWPVLWTYFGRAPNYYRCPTRQFKGKEICPNQKLLSAEEAEEEVWWFVSSLMQDPDRLRVGLNAMVEERRTAMRSDPKWEARTWLRKLEEVDLKRRRAQDLAIQGLLDADELGAKLAELKDTREMVERELEALEDHREQIEQLERNRDCIMQTYASMASSALSALTSEERNQIYRVLRLRVSAEIGGMLEVSGELVTAPDACSAERTYS